MITYKVVGFIANCHQSMVEANQDFDTHQEEGSLFQDMFTNPSENFSGLANKGLSIKGLPLDSRGVFFIDRDGVLFRCTRIRQASDLI